MAKKQEREVLWKGTIQITHTITTTQSGGKISLGFKAVSDIGGNTEIETRLCESLSLFLKEEGDRSDKLYEEEMQRRDKLHEDILSGKIALRVLNDDGTTEAPTQAFFLEDGVMKPIPPANDDTPYIEIPKKTLKRMDEA